jgi:predicted ester cyclase
MTIEDMVAEGDHVVVRMTTRGTNTGDIVTPTMHVPATGKQVTMTGILIARLASNRVVEIWHQVDYLGLFQQLGLIPVPQPAR